MENCRNNNMTLREKITGYAAWHPEQGFLDYREGKGAYKTYCVMPDEQFCIDSAHVRTGSQFVQGQNAKGWQIKRVIIVGAEVEKEKAGEK
jgi:hypothetical protein